MNAPQPIKTAVTTDLTPAIQRALRQVDALMQKFETNFPGDTTEQQFYQPSHLNGLPVGSNNGWTGGFWTGMLWLAYELSGEQRYRAAAERYLPNFEARVESHFDLDHHDLGFLYIPTCVAAYKLTANEDAARTAVKAADTLMKRYLPNAGIIQAWGDLKDPQQQGRIIIDCLMNVPLLNWASAYGGDGKYRDAALSHLKQSQQYLVREDSSAFHTFHFDPQDGSPRHGSTHQGARDDSAWARGQAWGVYGFALNHKRAPELGLLETAKRQAAYFLAHLPADRVPYWDLCFGDGSGEPRDSSASAIAACGLLEIASQLPAGEERAFYEGQARALVTALIEHCSGSMPATDGLLSHGVYHKRGDLGVDEANLWGDYYYLEALARLQKGWQPYC